MHMSAPFPILAGLGMLTSLAMVRSRDLSVPLWLGRQYIKWSVISVLICVFLGYALLQRGFNQDEQRKLFLDYQQRLEKDKMSQK